MGAMTLSGNIAGAVIGFFFPVCNLTLMIKSMRYSAYLFVLSSFGFQPSKAVLKML